MEKVDKSRNYYMLKGPLATHGYDWWWHNFTAYHKKTGEVKSFFIEYFICNPGLGEDKPVLGQLPENKEKKKKPSYAMIKVGTWGKDAKQIHNFYPISSFYSYENKLEICIEDNYLTEIRLKGACKLSNEEAKAHPEYLSDAGEMIFDLRMKKTIAYQVGFGASKLFRTMNAFEMYWHAQGIKTLFSGKVLFDGEEYEVLPEKSFGYSDKNWGSDFTSPWLWISSCDLKSTLTNKTLTNSAVEFGGGKPRIFGHELVGKLLGGLYYEGKLYEYNFSKFWQKSAVKFSFTEGEVYNVWKVKAENKTSRLDMVVKCKREEMLFMNYEAPSGEVNHKHLWNGGTGTGKIRLYEKRKEFYVLVDEIKMEHIGCEYGEYEK